MYSRCRTSKDIQALCENRNLRESLEELQEDVDQLRQRQERYAAQWQVVSAEQQQHCTDLASMYQQLQNLLGESTALESVRCSTFFPRHQNVTEQEKETEDPYVSSLRTEVQDLLLNFRQHIERHVAATGEQLENMKSDIHRMSNSVEEFKGRITQQDERLAQLEVKQTEQNQKIGEICNEFGKKQANCVQRTDLDDFRNVMFDAIQSAKNEWIASTQELKSYALTSNESAQREILHSMNLSIEELRSTIDTIVTNREIDAKNIEEHTHLRLEEHRQHQKDDFDERLQQLEFKCSQKQVAETKRIEVNLHTALQTLRDDWTRAAEKQRQDTISLTDLRFKEELLPVWKALDETKTDFEARMEETAQNVHSVEKRAQNKMEALQIQFRTALDEFCERLKLQDDKFIQSATLVELEANFRESVQTARDDCAKTAEEQKSLVAYTQGALMRDGMQAISDVFQELRALADALVAKTESTAGKIEQRVHERLEASMNDHITRTCAQLHRVHVEMSGKHVDLVEDTTDTVAKIAQVADDLPQRVALLQENVKDLHVALLRHSEMLNDQCLHGSLQGAFDEMRDWLQDLERRALSRGEFKEAIGYVDEKIALARREFIMHTIPERISLGEENVVNVDNVLVK